MALTGEVSEYYIYISKAKQFLRTFSHDELAPLLQLVAKADQVTFGSFDKETLPKFKKAVDETMCSCFQQIFDVTVKNAMLEFYTRVESVATQMPSGSRFFVPDAIEGYLIGEKIIPYGSLEKSGIGKLNGLTLEFAPKFAMAYYIVKGVTLTLHPGTHRRITGD